MRVLLVTMPFADIDRPALGISLLKARLRAADIDCDVAYLNLAFARLLGREAYQRIADGVPYSALAGDRVFAASLYGSPPTPDDSYVADVLRTACRCSPQDVESVEGAAALAEGFIAEQLHQVPWRKYDVVGFTSLCAQNVASLALARAVKYEHPSVVIVFGGANWHGVMGRELHRCFRFVDFAFSGEADVSFPQLVEHLVGPGVGSLSKIAGIVYRDHGRTTASGAASPVEDLDSLPIPDFTDFYEAYSSSSAVTRALPVLLAETARGCWWAADHPCRFCGLNAETRSFRVKRPDRIVSELQELARRWPARTIELVDNVVSPAFFSRVLPCLVAARLPAPIFLEARPDMSDGQVNLLSAARGSMQVGIESLSDHVLELMGKGTTTLENLRLLVRCRQNGVRVYWNVIHGFPGETQEDYRRMATLVPAIRHLDPPVSCGRLKLDRFSPFFERPEEHGFRNVRPLAAYRHVYPFSEASLRNIAYSFEYDQAAEVERVDVAELHEQVDAWRDAFRLQRLTSEEAADGSLALLDTRAEAQRAEIALDWLEQLLYRACEDIRSREELLALATRDGRDDGRVEEDVDSRLASFVERRLMATLDGRYLSLAVPSRPSP